MQILDFAGMNASDKLFFFSGGSMTVTVKCFVILTTGGMKHPEQHPWVV
jgi:hypothetical protein